MTSRNVSFAVRYGDVTNFDADVIVLKYAQWLYGADHAVANALGKDIAQMEQLLPAIGSQLLLPSHGSITARYALFLSVPDIYDFGYAEIRKFGAKALEVLAAHAAFTQHVAMTIHGMGYGLDETEALQSQLAGILDALEAGQIPLNLKRITIVELDRNRAERLDNVLATAIRGRTVELPKLSATREGAFKRSAMVSNVGLASDSKPHVYVAMPSGKVFDDHYYLGVEETVRNAGYLCERVSLSTGFVAGVQDGMASTYLSDLSDFLINHFSDEELRTLCFELGIDYDNLTGFGKAAKSRELVLFLSRRARVIELAQKVRSQRRNVAWPESLRINSTEQFLFEQVKPRIDTASLVIADLSIVSHSVFLLLGYAWGKGCPTILLLREDRSNLPIDVRGQRFLVYDSILDLREALKKELLHV